MMQASAIENGTVLQGEYVLLEAIDDLDGCVHHARHIVSARPVVVRLWRSEDRDAIERVLDQLEIARRVRHPSLAALEAFGVLEDGTVFVVSEHVAGEALDDWSARVGIPPLPSVVELVQRLCVGLNAAHRNGLAHDALSSRNVRVMNEGSTPGLRLDGKLLDLGIPARMRAWPPGLARARFMAPEQLARALRASDAVLGADAAMNVFSCGCLLYDLCTGGAPFHGKNLEELARAHAAARIVPASRINPQVSPALDAVILRALSIAPEERFASMAELAAALGRVRPSRTGSGVRALEVPRESSPVTSTPPVRDRRATAKAGFTERPTTESRADLLDALDAIRPRAQRSSAPAGSFSAAPPPVPVSASATPMRPPLPPARSSRPQPPPPPEAALATGRASEQPGLLPISALLQEQPQELLLDVPDAAEHAPRQAPQAIEPARRRTRLSLVAAGALALVASAAGASFLMNAALVSTETEGREHGAAPSSRPVRMERARAVISPTVVAPAPPSVAEPVSTDEVADGLADPELPSAVSGKRPARASDRDDTSERSGVARAPKPVVTTPTLRILAAAESDEPPAALEELEAVEPPGWQDPLSPGSSARVAADVAARTPSPSSSTPATRSAIAPTPPPAPQPAPAPSAPRSTPRAATLRIQELAVRGSLATSEVRRAVERLEPQLAACYTRAAKLAGHARVGVLSVEVEIDERGRAHAPHATGGALPGLDGCVARAVGKLAARPPDTGTVKALWKVAFGP